MSQKVVKPEELIQGQNADVNAVVDSAENEVKSLFEQFAEGADDNGGDDFADIVKKLQADKVHCVTCKSLDVTNVNVDVRDNHTFVAITVLQKVFGKTASATQKDAFGNPLTVIGKTNVVSTSSFAIHGVAKRNGKTALLATRLNSDDAVEIQIATENLLIGSKIDVICQFVKSGEEYVNPFARHPQPVKWDVDMVIHHVIAIHPGEIQNDAYKARFAR